MNEALVSSHKSKRKKIKHYSMSRQKHSCNIKKMKKKTKMS